MFLCYRLRVVPYALLNVCANLFYCLVKYILANISYIIGVVNDSKSVVLNRVSERLFSDIKQKGTHGRDFERWTCPDQAESDSGSKTARVTVLRAKRRQRERES